MVMLAFPGMGKTPLSQKLGRFMDLDFGNFREAMNVKKEDEDKLLESFARLIKIQEDQGYIVLTNEPKLMRYIKVDRMFLPTKFKYSAKKLGVSSEQAEDWALDWAALARHHNVPVIWIGVGLDHYLGGAR